MNRCFSLRSLRNFVTFIYLSRVVATQIFSFSLQKGNTRSGSTFVLAEVLTLSVILISILSSYRLMLSREIFEIVCTLCAVVSAISVTSFNVRSFNVNFSKGKYPSSKSKTGCGSHVVSYLACGGFKLHNPLKYLLRKLCIPGSIGSIRLNAALCVLTALYDRPSLCAFVKNSK